jgi:hypothetical protein
MQPEQHPHQTVDESTAAAMEVLIIFIFRHLISGSILRIKNYSSSTLYVWE